MHCITLRYVPQIHHYFLNQFFEICIHILSRSKLLSSSIIIIIKVEGLTWQLMKACSVNLQNKSNEIKEKEHQIHDYRMESGNQWRSPTKRPKQPYNFINHPKPEKRKEQKAGGSTKLLKPKKFSILNFDRLCPSSTRERALVKVMQWKNISNRGYTLK